MTERKRAELGECTNKHTPMHTYKEDELGTRCTQAWHLPHALCLKYAERCLTSTKDGADTEVLRVSRDSALTKLSVTEKSRVAQELQTFIDTANAPIFGIDAQGRVNEW